jgi:repressor LexA
LIRLNDVAPVARVPLLGRVVAGSPVSTEEVADWRVPVPAEWIGRSSGFALRVCGDSMVGAGIQDGDVVVVRQQGTAKDGDVVAATIGAETTLKRFRRRKGRVVLAAANPAYPDIEVGSEDLVIHGVAVGLLRKLAPASQMAPSRRTVNKTRAEYA